MPEPKFATTSVNPTIANNIALVDEAARRKKGLN